MLKLRVAKAAMLPAAYGIKSKLSAADNSLSRILKAESRPEQAAKKQPTTNFARLGMQYEVYIDSVLMPVAPGKIKTKINGKDVTVDLASGGELDILNDPGLTGWEFELFLPNNEYPFAQYQNGYQNAKYYLDVFERIKLEKKVFPFVILRNFDDTSDTVVGKASLKDYEILEDVQELSNNMRVSVAIRKYNPLKTEKVTTETTGMGEASEVKVTVEEERPEDMPPTPETYTVKSGDTLYAICKIVLGDGEKFRDIAALNGIVNPNIIMPGQVIRFA